MSKTEELLPCPFCGGVAEYQLAIIDNSVECQICRASTRCLNDKYCKPEEHSNAINKWNTRASLPRDERQQRDVVGEDVPQEVYWAAYDAWLNAKGTHYGDIVMAVNAALSALPASLPRLSVEEVAGVIRGEFIGRDWLSTPMGVMVHDIASAIRDSFPQLFKGDQDE